MCLQLMILRRLVFNAKFVACLKFEYIVGALLSLTCLL